MAKIVAVGTLWGQEITTTVTNDDGSTKVLFDGKENRVLLRDLDAMTRLAPTMANGYSPEAGTMLAYYNSLSTNFYNKLKKIEVKGELEEIPTYEGANLY